MTGRAPCLPTRWLTLVALPVLVGCYQPRRLLMVTPGPDVLEGQRARVTLTVQNILSDPIIPVSLTFYERADPAEQLARRRILGEREYLEPLQAAKVRHMATLNRVEADQVRDGGVWRRVPDTRFLHPRILLPGQSIVETFEFQAIESHAYRLACDLYYFRLASDEIRDRIYVRDKTLARRGDDDHYTEVFTITDPRRLALSEPRPADFLLYRRRIPSPQATRVVTRRVPLRVKPRKFSLRQAAVRARYAARAYVYYPPANAWVFDYDDGTWFVTPSATVKLRGDYLTLAALLASEEAQTLSITAPRRQGDKLLDYFHQSAFADPKATGDTARATIPTDRLLEVLQHAESLGYAIDRETWRPVAAAP